MPIETPKFAATYLINLPRSTARWEAMQPVLASMGIFNAIRFNGINGFELGDDGIRQIQGSGRLAETLSEFDPQCALGEIGCALSHAAVLQNIVGSGWATALILEDDIALAGSSSSWQRRFHSAFADLPECWELWYLYRCFDIRPLADRVTRRTVIPWAPEGGAAYAVTQAGARKLLSALTPVANAVDRTYAALVRARSINAWAASPRLILPGNQPSIINGGNLSKRWMKNGVNRPPEYWPDDYLAHLGEDIPNPRFPRLRRLNHSLVRTVRAFRKGGA